MASGFGKFATSDYQTGTSSVTVAKLAVRVTQDVNATTRVVTVTVRASLGFYRVSGNYDVSNGTQIFGNYNTSEIYAHVGNSSGSTTNLSLNGNTSFRASGGNLYTSFGWLSSNGWQDNTQYVKAGSSGVYEHWASHTYSYNNDGDAITGTWDAWLKFRGKTPALSLSGSFTTDSIAPVYKCHLYGPVNGRAREIGKSYGSVNGVAKKITKLYAGDENGIARLIYKG